MYQLSLCLNKHYCFCARLRMYMYILSRAVYRIRFRVFYSWNYVCKKCIFSFSYIFSINKFNNFLVLKKQQDQQGAIESKNTWKLLHHLLQNTLIRLTSELHENKALPCANSRQWNVRLGQNVFIVVFFTVSVRDKWRSPYITMQSLKKNQVTGQYFV